MKKILTVLVAIMAIAVQLNAQLEPTAGTWKTWFISSGKDYRLNAPSSYKPEIAEVLAIQKNLDASGLQQISFWNAGAPGYRWQEMIAKVWTTELTSNGILAQMLLSTAIYDATVAAWDTKYAFNRPRPYIADKRIKLYVPKPESPSYPCEHSIAAGVAVTIIGKYFPKLADSANRMAQQAMTSRIAAGVVFPSDTRAGFELGKRIAEKEIEYTKDYVTTAVWDGKRPEGPAIWSGKMPMFPVAGLNKTVVLKTASEFRPAPPPDFAKDMAEMKNFKQTFRSQANAFHYASQNTNEDLLGKKIFEYNLHLNPPRAARIYAINGVTVYDCFVACFDAKYAYWGIRPDQYDTTYHPIVPTPPFPGYPSGHATMSGMISEMYSYFFPAERAYFQKIAKDGAESRFQAGIHFRTDNEVGLELGRKVAARVIQKVKDDGADNNTMMAQKTAAMKD
ncbi:MAG: phosphatase PAP2 family protein [Chitinophagales bacterium]